MNDYVLVVDDEEVNRKLLVKILRQSMKWRQLQDGKQALQMLKAQPHKYAAIVLDLVMPDMNGFPFWKNIAVMRYCRIFRSLFLPEMII